MAEQNLKALKTLVISMGIVMMVGMIVVAAAVAMKMKPGASAVQCAGGEVNLTGRGRMNQCDPDHAPYT